jgi:hypothetical protein
MWFLSPIKVIIAYSKKRLGVVKKTQKKNSANTKLKKVVTVLICQLLLCR